MHSGHPWDDSASRQSFLLTISREINDNCPQHFKSNSLNYLLQQFTCFPDITFSTSLCQPFVTAGTNPHALVTHSLITLINVSVFLFPSGVYLQFFSWHAQESVMHHLDPSCPILSWSILVINSDNFRYYVYSIFPLFCLLFTVTSKELLHYHDNFSLSQSFTVLLLYLCFDSFWVVTCVMNDDQNCFAGVMHSSITIC